MGIISRFTLNREKSRRKWKSPYVEAAESLLENYNFNTTDLDAFVSIFESPDSPFMFEDAPPIPAKTVAKISIHKHMCFPDISYKVKSIEDSKSTRGLVEIYGLRVSGTHTGIPYTFDPSKFPPIPATGNRFRNDKEHMTVHVNEHGKISKVQIVALGKFSGAMGVYEQLSQKYVPKPSSETSSRSSETSSD